MKRRVPRKQAELIAFARAIMGGLKENPNIFSDSPVTSKQLTDIINAAIRSEIELANKKAYYQMALETKKKNMSALYETTAEITNYLYRVGKKDKTLLLKAGINAPTERKTPEKPGQCLNLIIVKQEIGGNVILQWKQPQEGGVVKSYIIERQESASPVYTWQNIWTQVGKQVKIKNQPADKTFDYRVRALNRLGAGTPSNVVTVKF